MMAFNKLTKNQLRVFEAIAINNDSGHNARTLAKLEWYGMIVGKKETIGGFPPVSVIRYHVPIRVHMAWCQWCSEGVIDDPH